jgi:hypothetical protein
MNLPKLVKFVSTCNLLDINAKIVVQLDFMIISNNTND